VNDGDAQMIVYFDTNVFDHLEQLNGVRGWELFRIQRAVKHAHIRLIFSYLNIEETLFIVSSQSKRAEARVKLILELTDKHLFALGQEVIMNNDIRADAHGMLSLSPFITLASWMECEIWRLVKPTGNYSSELEGLVDETRRAKKMFQDFLTEGRAKVKPMADSIGARQYPFENYWTNNSGWLAEGLARRARVLAKVKKRGVDGLLKVKTVALAVGANLSLMYSHHLENRTPSSGDSRDILHAVVASTADVFVTNDKRLETVLNRIPVEGFQAMSLQAFLNSLPKWI
jgi:predicted nucleic acid-binding protein